MASCCASFCNNTSCNSKARFFRFPRGVERCTIWIQYCRNHQSWIPQDHHRLCDNHFDDDQFESNRADNKKKLKQNAIPNVVAMSNVSPETSANTTHVAICQQEFVCVESNSANCARSDHNYNAKNNCKNKRKKISPDTDVNTTPFELCKTNESMSVDESNSLDQDHMTTIHDLQLELRQLRRKLQQSEDHLANLKANLATFLRDDQISRLQMKNRSSSRCSEWSNETIQHALSIRTSVGRNGYEQLRKLGYPLPSYRTLCRRLESAPFAPGIQTDVIEWLKCKLAEKKDQHKECVLLVDEMQLKQRVEYDKGLRQLVGYVSPEAMTPAAVKAHCKEMASHALVFMVRGLAVSWKQTVAYLYTGSKLDKEVFWNFMKKVISSLEIAGLKVLAVTSDMGPINVGMWNCVGVKSTKDEVIPAVPHPTSADRLLYFIADPPHLLKNLWNCLLTNQITVGPSTMLKYNLTSPVIDSAHIKSLISLQTGHSLRLAYKLHNAHINVQPQEVTILSSSPCPVEKSDSHMIGCLEASALHDITGWALSKALAGVTCSVCRKAFVLSVPTDSEYAMYTSSRSYGGLVHPTDYMLGAMKMLESVFLCHQSTIHESSNVLETITQEALDVLDAVGYKFPECHHVLSKVVHKYIRLRVHSFGVSATRAMVTKRQFGSKTACRNTIIQ